MRKKDIYLDYNATTPVDPRVVEVMLPYFSEHFGNAASRAHAFGWVADEAVKTAREQIASFINASPSEIVFTSGSTESINLALKGAYQKYSTSGRHILTVSSEHRAVLDTCLELEKAGAELSILPVEKDGSLDLDALKKAIRPDTILVAIMYANNETGLIHPVEEIAKIVHEKHSIFFCDGTQAVGKIRLDVQESGIDLFCFSAHKMYGPKGIGALYIRKKNPRVVLQPQISGGGHENGMRSGTLNVPAIVGFGKACEIAANEQWEFSTTTSRLRTILEQGLTEGGNVFINGSVKNRLPNVSNLCFAGIKADDLITHLKDIAVSSGSACSSALAEPSHVLKAMGLSDEMAYASIRFSLGKYTTEEEIDYAITTVLSAYNKLSSEKMGKE
jgi:cysteine desulfurase